VNLSRDFDAILYTKEDYDNIENPVTKIQNFEFKMADGRHFENIGFGHK